ncbi:MAG: hypothetical protein I8H77_13210 [Comamonadaceae bacterium]|nr:hypothetical protein [Comamonadaceae bacterium]
MLNVKLMRPDVDAGAKTGAQDTGFPSGKRADWWLAFFILVVSMLVFNSNLRSIGAADTYAARYLPLSIWKHGTLALDPIAEHVGQGERPSQGVGEVARAWWMLRTPEGRLVSIYPPITPLLVAPLYLPAVQYLNWVGWDSQRVERVARIMEKLTASLVASITVALMYLLLRRQCSVKMAASLALLFAFGTSTWVISSQALWVHGIAQLLVLGALWLVTGPRCTPLRAFTLGLICSLIACNRPPDAILVAGFAAYALVWGRGYLTFLIAGAFIPAAALLAYNLEMVGNPMGGYGVVSEKLTLQFTVWDTAKGFAALLFSPVQGLLVFSPFLVLIPLRFGRLLERPSMRLLAALLGGAVLAQLLFYAAVHWSPGVSWGPRFLTDMLPILFWMLPPLLIGLGQIGRWTFALLGTWAVVIAAIGAFGYTGSAHLQYMNAHVAKTWTEQKAIYERAAWTADYSPILARPALFNDLFPGFVGSIDRLTVSPDGLATVEGWALFGKKQAYDLSLLVDGSRVLGSTSEFAFRADVSEQMRTSQASAWKISFPAELLSAGPHVFSAKLRSHPEAMPWMLHGFKLTVPERNSPTDGAARWRGSIDAIRVFPGRGVDVVGWTSLGATSPGKLELWIDGAKRGEIDSFFRRHDVEQAVGVRAPSGWRVQIPARDLSPGEHTVAVVLPGKNSASPRHLLEKSFEVERSAPPVLWTSGMPLSDMAKIATWTLQNQQDNDGYWLTDFTDGLRFLSPHTEMNLFTTAMILDLLEPTRERLKLSPMLDKARQFLSAQIEESGLVRYHGRADLQSHGVLGCRITPDADDTALVWRLAPNGNKAQQVQALATLEKFKTPQGLYKTWLASPDRYECIDPGKDLNPVDIGIQLHVLMWLHKVDSAAAKRLCRALQLEAGNESLWVYYKDAPAAIAWRRQALSGLGCPLQLPDRMMLTQDADQRVWLEVIERIHKLESSPPQHHKQRAMELAQNESLLREIAGNGFEQGRKAPVRYFHNDLTATVSRYYWSTEMGLALWLRLFDANEQAQVR